MRKLLILFLLFPLLFTSIAYGQSKRQLREQKEAEELEKQRIELAQQRAELELKKTILADNVKKRLESGEIEPPNVHDPGGELCNCSFGVTPPSDVVVKWTNPIGGDEYICVNYGLGDVILTWRKWYCLGEGDNCVRSKWKHGEPTFSIYGFGENGDGSMSFNNLYFNGITINMASYSRLSYKERLSEYLTLAQKHKYSDKEQEILNQMDLGSKADGESSIINTSANNTECFSTISPGPHTTEPVVEVDNPLVNFGQLVQNEKFEHLFVLSNSGKSMLNILEIRAACECITVYPEKKEIAPNESVNIKTIFNSTGRLGNQYKTVLITTNDPKRRNLVLLIKGEVIIR